MLCISDCPSMLVSPLLQKSTREINTQFLGYTWNGLRFETTTCPDATYIVMWLVTKAYDTAAGDGREYIESVQGVCSDGTLLVRMGGVSGSDFRSRQENVTQSRSTGVNIGFAGIGTEQRVISQFGTVQSKASVSILYVLGCPLDMLISGYGGTARWYINSIFFVCIRQATQVGTFDQGLGLTE
eukprot:365593-Chlamydomonas_euryale.AAC.5